MKIGITERGDAGIDLSWVDKMNNIDGAILITKNITEKFMSTVLDLYNNGEKIIIHCTCTGYGGTRVEPNVPDYKTQLNNLKILIEKGFPAEQCVLRIDPLFPSEKGMGKFHNVLSYFYSLNTGITRIRVSIVDEYKHVKERYKEVGLRCLYDGFQANDEQINLVIENLAMYPQNYEICAENRLYQLAVNKYKYLFEVVGCISNKDLEILNLPTIDTNINPQNRNGCHCLSCKTELLNNRKQCPHKCVYCYWKDN